MAPSPFRSAAVVCSIITASLGVGVLSPVTATAATSSSDSAVTQDAPVDSIPVDPALAPPRVASIEDTAAGSRAVLGSADADEVHLLSGDTTVSRWPGGQGLFLLRAPDSLGDAPLDLVRVHTAADGTTTRTERSPLPRTLHVDGLRERNVFTPGTNAFSGTASAGATITATDESGATLFTTEATSTRTATGSWRADAELSDAEHAVTFTQSLPDGRTSVINRAAFAPAADVAPAAPVVQPAERRLEGDFTLWGSVGATTAEVEVRDAAGARITSGRIVDGEFTATVPQDQLGNNVDVVAIAKDGTESAPSDVALRPLPVDDSVTTPAVRRVNVLPNGAVQVIGEVQQFAGAQVLDGDRVVGYVRPDSAGWSFNIGRESTGKQLDLVFLGFDGQRYSATSERVPLPRLLQVDGIAEKNSYTPGEREFSGSAEAGSTVVATAQDGTELFRAEAKPTRSGTAEWTARADLPSKDGYQVTFTQTTADGRTSTMRDIDFTAETATPADLAVTSHKRGGTFVVGPQLFEGTATPGAVITMNPFGFDQRYAAHDLTAIADATSGKWSIPRALADAPYRAVAFKQTPQPGVVDEVVDFALYPAQSLGAAADLVLTAPGTTFSPGTPQTFAGTATPGTLVTLLPFGEDPRYASSALTATADQDTGAWAITRPLANQVYPVVITQEDGDDKVRRIAQTMRPAN
jgi:hypothetical protein